MGTKDRIRQIWLLCLMWSTLVVSGPVNAPSPEEMDTEQTRKLLGSSVVTSVSVIMEHGNGSKTYISDGKAVPKPHIVGTPGTFLSPDRYEFYSFDEEGELVKKLMTLEQIQGLIAGGDELQSEETVPVYYHQPLIDNTDTEGVQKVLTSVQNVLKGELEASKIKSKLPMPLPDDSWSILLPGLLNPGMDMKDTQASKQPTVTPKPATTTMKTQYTPTIPPITHKTPTLSNTPKIPSTYTTQFPNFISTKFSPNVKYPHKRPPQAATTMNSYTTPTTTKYSSHYSTAKPIHHGHRPLSQIMASHHTKKPLHHGAKRTTTATTTTPTTTTTPPKTPPLTTLPPTTQPPTTLPPTTLPPTTLPPTTLPPTTMPPTTMPPTTMPPTTLPPTTQPPTTLPPTTLPPTTLPPTTMPPTTEVPTTMPPTETVPTTPVGTTYPETTVTETTTMMTTSSRPQPPYKPHKPYKPSGTVIHYLPIQNIKPPKPQHNKPHRPLHGGSYTTATEKPTTSTNTTQYTTQVYSEKPSTAHGPHKKHTRPTQYTTQSTYPSSTQSSSNSSETTPTSVSHFHHHKRPKPSYATSTMNTQTYPQTSTEIPVTSPVTHVFHKKRTKPTAAPPTTYPPTQSTSEVTPTKPLPPTYIPHKKRPTFKPAHQQSSWPTSTPPLENSTATQAPTAPHRKHPKPTIYKITTYKPTTNKPTEPPTSSTVGSPGSAAASSNTFRIKVPLKTVTTSTKNITTTTTEKHKVTVDILRTTTKAPESSKIKINLIELQGSGSGFIITSTEKIYPKNKPSPSTHGELQSTVQQKPTTYQSMKPTTNKVNGNEMTTEISNKSPEKISPVLYSTKAPISSSKPPQVNYTFRPSSETKPTHGMVQTHQMSTTPKTTPMNRPSTMDYKPSSESTSSPEKTSYSPTTTKISTLVQDSTKYYVPVGTIGTETSSFVSQNSGTTMNGPYNAYGEKYTTMSWNTTETEDDKYGTTTELPSTTPEDLRETEITQIPSEKLPTPEKFAAPTPTLAENVNENPHFIKVSSSKNNTKVTEGEYPMHSTLPTTISDRYQQVESTTVNFSQINESETETPLSETEQSSSTEMTPMDRDEIIQEGISAVTNLLLEELQDPSKMKQPIPAPNISFPAEVKIPVTENTPITYVTSTERESTESTTNIATETTMYDSESFDASIAQNNEEKSEVRQGEIEIHDSIPQTTALPEITTNSPAKPVIKIQAKPSHIIPTKESKLNPDDELEELEKKLIEIKLESFHDSTENKSTSPSESTTLKEEKTTPVPIYEKSAPKPDKYASKPVSSAYQSSENLHRPSAVDLHPAPLESMGLEASTAFLNEDVRRFSDLCNELAFRLWTSITGKGQISSRSLVMSPFAAISLLAMVFLGARGPTSGQMNDILRLDDMVTFNPHQVFRNVTESVINSKNYGVATAAFVRELYSDKVKGRILDFYKERAQQYYDGHVEEVSFSMVGDVIRRRTNLLVKRQTLGKVPEYLRGASLNLHPPLAAFSANIFQTDCELGSTDGRDGEMYFVVRPSTRQRRLVPVPAVVWRSGFLAGYEPSLDATSICLGSESVVSTILVLPGQQGQVAPGDGLARLEQRLIESSYRRGAWSRLLRSLLPRPGLELQVPRFSHRSVLNVTGALQRMGLKDLFNRRADLRGLNGVSNDLHLSDMIQVNTFSTCGEETVGARHHIETYPASPQRMGREEPEYFPPPDYESAFSALPLALRPRQARLPDNPRLRFDRPFLYMVRHNPTGMVLHMGRFNPRLLP